MNEGAKGLGTALMNILVDFVCRELNKEKIILNVFSWNIGAIKCYEKVGFVQTNKPIEVMKVGNEEWEIMEMAKNGVTGRN
ncbi:GNAT family N-acetyltransferase [Flagellimonas halotolerans]|uniref:GNAT family N-acetyltransferase n=1 Tax=Flagellimonas halotolerans TaxID=3112164 RepID=UPI003D16D696